VSFRSRVLLPLLVGALLASASQSFAQMLEGFASLRGDTFAAGPTTGQFITTTNGRTPFDHKQPVQGFSSVLRAADGDFLAMPKIFVVNLDEIDANGLLIKREVADLLHISDPANVGGFGPVFRFPFQTIESVIPLSEVTLGVLNDNNYPFSSGRTPGQPDPNEFIVIRLDQPIAR
jgi:hypothetical protein